MSQAGWHGGNHQLSQRRGPARQGRVSRRRTRRNLRGDKPRTDPGGRRRAAAQSPFALGETALGQNDRVIYAKSKRTSLNVNDEPATLPPRIVSSTFELESTGAAGACPAGNVLIGREFKTGEPAVALSESLWPKFCASTWKSPKLTLPP